MQLEDIAKYVHSRPVLVKEGYLTALNSGKANTLQSSILKLLNKYPGSVPSGQHYLRQAKVEEVVLLLLTLIFTPLGINARQVWDHYKNGDEEFYQIYEGVILAVLSTVVYSDKEGES